MLFTNEKQNIRKLEIISWDIMFKVTVSRQHNLKIGFYFDDDDVDFIKFPLICNFF